jgi:hypothetical protein
MGPSHRTSDGYRGHPPQVMTKSTGTEQVRSRGNDSGLYSENARFETRPGHRLTVRGLMILFRLSKCLNSTSIRPREIPSKSSPMHYQTSYHSTLHSLRHKQHRQIHRNELHIHISNKWLVANTRSQTDKHKGGNGFHMRGVPLLRKERLKLKMRTVCWPVIN